MEVLQFLFEVLPVSLPCHAIDPWRSVLRERQIAPFQELGGDVMQQRSEPLILTLSRRLAHGCQSIRRGTPALRPDRGCLTAVSLERGPSLHDLRRGQASLFGRFSGTVTPSDFSSACMFTVRLLPS